MFFTAVNPMYADKIQEEVQYDLDKPRIVVYKNTWRILGIPHSAVQKEYSNRKEIVTRRIQQFETHPNRDSPIEDLNKDWGIQSIRLDRQGDPRTRT